MSPLEFMQLPNEWPVCGEQIRFFNFCNGSMVRLSGSGASTAAGVDGQAKATLPAAS